MVRQASSSRLGFWLFSMSFGTNVPVPLLLVYRSQLGLTATTLSAIFAVYAAGMIPALAVGGPASERWGRRHVALPAAWLAIVSSAIYLFVARGLVVLFVARFVQGAASGIVFTVGSAWLVETGATARRAGARTAAIALTGGFSAGCLVGGLLGQWAPAPTVVPYVVHIVLACASQAAVWRVADVAPAPRATVWSTVSRAPLLRQGCRREALTVVAPSALCVYGLPAIAINAVPLLMQLPLPQVFGAGVLGCLTLGAGAAAVPLHQRLRDRTALVSAAMAALGLTLVAIGAAVSALRPLVLIATLPLGCSGGLALIFGLMRVPSLAGPQRLASVTGAFYAIAYTGFALPLVLAELRGALGTVGPFAALAAAAALLCWRQARWMADRASQPAVLELSVAAARQGEAEESEPGRRIEDIV